MKDKRKILLYFYSCENLGDDLFVKTLADYFPDCRIRLIANPRFPVKMYGDNVRLHPHSVLNLVFEKIRSVFGENSKLGMLADKCNKRCFRAAAATNDAYVYLGGSVFMEHVRGMTPIDFSVRK